MDNVAMRCSRCKKDQSYGEFEMTKRGLISKRCKSCMEHMQRDTTCKRCLKTFPIDEFRIGKQGKPITFCAKCSETTVRAQRKLLAGMRELNKLTVSTGSKSCVRCRATKTLDEFKDGRGYVRRLCTPCREYAAGHRAKRKTSWTDVENGIDRLRYLKAQRALRAEVVAAYGGICRCCGEDIPEFLAVDHIEGNGREHRRQLKREAESGEHKTAALYNWLRSRGYPEGFQVLCHNCNVAKGLYGTCPHRKNPLLLVETLGLGPMVVKSSGAPKRLVN